MNTENTENQWLLVVSNHFWDVYGERWATFEEKPTPNPEGETIWSGFRLMDSQNHAFFEAGRLAERGFSGSVVERDVNANEMREWDFDPL